MRKNMCKYRFLVSTLVSPRGTMISVLMTYGPMCSSKAKTRNFYWPQRDKKILQKGRYYLIYHWPEDTV